MHPFYLVQKEERTVASPCCKSLKAKWVQGAVRLDKINLGRCRLSYRHMKAIALVLKMESNDLNSIQILRHLCLNQPSVIISLLTHHQCKEQAAFKTR